MNPILRIFYTFVFGLGQLFPGHKKKKKRCAYLVFGNLRNFQIVYEKKHSGSHAKRGLLLLHLYTRVFSGPPIQDVALQSHASHFTILKGQKEL